MGGTNQCGGELTLKHEHPCFSCVILGLHPAQAQNQHSEGWVMSAAGIFPLVHALWWHHLLCPERSRIEAICLEHKDIAASLSGHLLVVSARPRRRAPMLSATPPVEQKQVVLHHGSFRLGAFSMDIS